MHMNVLFILDDVIGDIKKHESSQRLAQFFLNRRHLLSNGTVSIMLVSQKYTLIPARIRSNANWLILFRLNPIDFENVFKDVVMTNLKMWQSLLKFVFEDDGGDSAIEQDPNKSECAQKMLLPSKHKKYDNLGMWVEYDMYFKNFNHLLINNH